MATLFITTMLREGGGATVDIGAFNLTNESKFYSYIANAVGLSDEIISSTHIFASSECIEILCSTENKQLFSCRTSPKNEKELEKLVFEACEKEDVNPTLIALKKTIVLGL